MKRYAAKVTGRLTPGGMERQPESIVLCKELSRKGVGRMCPERRWPAVAKYLA